MRECKTLSLLGLSFLLCSCNDIAIQHEGDTSGAVHNVAPEKWINAPQRVGEDIAWLESFHDPMLVRLVQNALTENFTLKTMMANMQAARQLATLSGAQRLPTVALSPSVQLNDSAKPHSLDVFSNVSWEIDIWGRLRAAQEAAENQAQATSEDWQALRLSLAAHTVQNYFELLEATLQVGVVEQSVVDRKKIVELVRGRYERGLTNGLDLRLVLTDLENANAQLASAKNQVQRIAMRLDVLLGQYPLGNMTVNATELPALPTMIDTGIPAQILERRPDIKAAFSRLQAANANLRSAQKALLPRLTLTAQGGSAQLLSDPRLAAWHLALGMVQPLFTGGRLTGEIHLSEHYVDSAQYQYQQTVLVAFQEVEQSLASEKWLSQEAIALKGAVEQTEASRDLAVYSYQQGLIQILTLLDSYRSTLNAQSQYLAVRLELLRNRLNLYLALGGAI
jgi:NodT family efflux transporter outer membrane factor (OMF) lipoprotein